jgi:uncharacterized protein YdhG (YjbR/CyaY superfamily)
VSGETQEVDAYLKDLNPERRTALSDLRAVVFEAVPGAIETMRYRMPTYEYGGDMLCAFASHKRYMSLYMDPRIVEEHKAELKGLSIGKSCIRFKRIEDLPLDTVRSMLSETAQGGGDT